MQAFPRDPPLRRLRVGAVDPGLAVLFQPRVEGFDIGSAWFASSKDPADPLLNELLEHYRDRRSPANLLADPSRGVEMPDRGQ